MNEPLEKLEEWWNSAKSNSPLKQKNAICLSTIDEHGFPNSRFIDLKSIEPNGLTFCSSYESPKGKDIQNNPNVGLTIWWDHVGYQIRIVGKATKAENELSESFWKTRNIGSQITTYSFSQSKIIDNENLLIKKTQENEIIYKNKKIPKPINWGAYIIEPISIEFLQFKENRIHIRELYKQDKNSWSRVLLQP